MKAKDRLLSSIRERLSQAEDSAVTCQGDGLDKDYIHALEAVSADTARLLTAITAIASGHKEIASPNGPRCNACRGDFGERLNFPCPTIRAIQASLEAGSQ